MKKDYVIYLTAIFIWTCSSSSSKPTEPTVPTQPPTVNNLTLTTNEDTPTTFTMTGTDPGNFALTFSIATQPQHGTLSTSGSSGTYTPKANYNGEDTFGFIATNGTLTSTAGVATITIAPVDDNPNTMNVSAITDEDNAVEITLEAEEYDGDTISFNIKDNPTNGTVSLTGDKATYTPNENYFGSDSFTFEAVDTTAKTILNTATASITINPINDAPAVEDMQEVEGVEDTELTITLTGTDIDGDNLSFEVDTAPTQGTITENGTTFTYTPNQDFYGADSLTYKAYDGTEYSEAKKIPLFIDRGPRDWPFIFSYTKSNSVLGTRPNNWEGKMFDYDGNGLANMIGFEYGDITIAEEAHLSSQPVGTRDYTVLYKIDVFSQMPSDVWSDGENDKNYWNGGTAEFGYINNDNVADIFVNFTREIAVNGVCCSMDAGPSAIGLSNGLGDYTWTVLEDSIQYWQDGNIEFTDFDKDGDLDLIGQDDMAYKVEVFNNPHLIFYKNDGQNNFSIEKIQLEQPVSLEEFRVDDINNDSYNDIIGFGGGGTGSLHILYGTSDYDRFTYYENNFADIPDSFQDLSIVDIDGDGSKEIITNRWVNSTETFKFSLFKDLGGYQESFDSEIVKEVRFFNGVIGKTQVWDFDNDGDKDIFFNHFIKFMDEGGEPSANNQCCYCWHYNAEVDGTDNINQGYFWKNNDGVLEKTYYSTKEEECNFDQW